MDDNANITPDPGTKSDGEKQSGTRDLLHEFFHEAICRILPGLVLLALYLPIQNFSDASKEDSIFKGTSIVLGFLVASWLAGTFVEISVFCPIGLFLRSNFGDRWEWFKAKKEEWKRLLLPEMRIDSNCNESDRRFYLKYCAEKVMYRSLALIFFISSIIPPQLISKWNLGYGAIAMAFSVSAWLYARSGLQELKGVTCTPALDHDLIPWWQLLVVTLVLLAWIVFTFWITFQHGSGYFLTLIQKFVK